MPLPCLALQLKYLLKGLHVEEQMCQLDKAGRMLVQLRRIRLEQDVAFTWEQNITVSLASVTLKGTIPFLT